MAIAIAMADHAPAVPSWTRTVPSNRLAQSALTGAFGRRIRQCNRRISERVQAG
ncbi:hypothetical protein ACFFX0_05085 [Citricoccus parietis]|uniref:Uncharacterized protein n=1 Tax=Citricoccus parietis TaxID=592307 RepID=A0ABV5FV85_9MICC